MTHAQGTGEAGGCTCGGARYELAALPTTAYACHCHQCQKRTGSAFSLTIVVTKAAFAGPPTGALHRLVSSDGTGWIWLCRTCGSRLWSETTGGDVVRIPQGTLDRPDNYYPAAQFWLENAQPWARLEGDLLSFDTQPETLDGVAAKWRSLQGPPEGGQP